MSRSEHHLLEVRPELAEVARRVQSRAAEEGIAISFVQGLRPEEQQAALYAQGRTSPGPVVTNAPHASSSAHGRGAALDFAVLDENGKATWADGALPSYDRVGAIAEEEGLEWGGRFPSPDRPHLQLAGWRDLPMPA